jgi:hypothetical protein
MINYVSIPANYQPTGVRRYDGNPFIEALPRMEDSKNDILARIEHYPDKPSAADRKKSELVRLAELGTVNAIVYPFAVYKRAGTNLTSNVREPYVARNPLSVEDKQRRHAIATDGAAGVPFPRNWQSTAKGQSLLGMSGSGKTTFCDAFSLPLQIVIEHTEYKGTPLACRQIPWIKLRVPHDGTLKSLCLQFFEVIDAILGNSRYVTEARSVRSISQMVALMAKVATTVSLGTVFADEVQNLKTARAGHAEFVLNLFSEIIEKAGVTLVIAGTPAIEAVIDKNVRNLRKLNSGGESRFLQMKLGDPEFNAFCDAYWDYQYVKKPKALSNTIRAAWYRAGAGNPAFTALVFMLAQRTEIGGRECIDEVSFERASKHDMSILGPAISALRSRDPQALLEFDDLLFTDGGQSLMDMIRRPQEAEEVIDDNEEFDEIASGEPAGPKGKAASRATPAKKPKAAASAEIKLPVENPLIRH